MKAGWEVKALGDVVQVVNGGTPKSSVKEYWGGNIEWLTPKDMGKLTGHLVAETPRKITSEGLSRCSARLVPERSIIMSTRAPIGHLAINTVPMAFNQGCRGMVPAGCLDLKYLFYFLSANIVLLNDLGTGTTFKELSSGALKAVPIPLPPLDEQKRIVAVLDAAFEGLTRARTHVETNLQNARELFEAQRKSLLSNLNADWQQLTIDQICRVERGSSPRPIKKYTTNEPDGVNWVKIGDTKIGSKYVRATKEKITPLGAQKSRRVEPGDFILTNSMTYGRPYIMATDGYIHDGWFVLRLGDKVESNFLFHALSSEVVQEQFRSLAAGAVVKNISGDLVKKAVIPVPPIREQIDLAKIMDEASDVVEGLEGRYRSKLQDLDDLRQSLLQKAFAGELT